MMHKCPLSLIKLHLEASAANKTLLNFLSVAWLFNDAQKEELSD